MTKEREKDVYAKYRELCSATWEKIIARAWEDEHFRQRLIANPKAVLAEYHVIVPDHVKCKVMEDTPDVKYLPIPLKPTHLSSEELFRLTGGQAAGNITNW